MYICVYIYIYLFIYIYRCITIYIFTCICIYIYMYMHIYMYVYIHAYIHIYIHTHVHAYIWTSLYWSRKLCKHEKFVCTRVEWYIRIWICVTTDVRFCGRVGAVTTFQPLRLISFRSRLDKPLVGLTQPQTKSIPEAKNRHGPHTAAKSEISGHAYSNSDILLTSSTNEYFTLAELLIKMHTKKRCYKCFE